MPKPPIIWSRAESSLDWTSPEILDSGNSITVVGSNTYPAGYFGNGTSPVTAGHIRLRASIFRSQAGTVEFWIKPNANNFGGTFNAILDNYATADRIDTNYTYSAFNVDSHKLVWTIFNTANASDCAMFQDAVSFVAGTWYHLAYVWNKDGMDGVSNKRYLLYIDNVLRIDSSNASNLYAAPRNTVQNLNENTSSYIRLGNSWDMNGRYLKGVIDNFKMYDYAKRDFSDRFSERSGLNDILL
jgi:hypothetical protein